MEDKETNKLNCPFCNTPQTFWILHRCKDDSVCFLSPDQLEYECSHCFLMFNRGDVVLIEGQKRSYPVCIECKKEIYDYLNNNPENENRIIMEVGDSLIKTAINDIKEY